MADGEQRGRGRPQIGTFRVNLVLSPETAETIKERAMVEGVTVSALVRHILTKSAKAWGRGRE